MKRIKILLITIIIITLLAGCNNATTPGTDNGTNNGTNDGTENGTEDGTDNDTTPDPVVSKEIPESFPKELVTLYDVAEVDGVISVGEDYHQAYYYSDTERTALLEKYKEFFKDKDVNVFENDYSYELSGNVDGHKVRMYIMPYNEEDENAVTTTGDNTPTEVETTDTKYQTTVIIFIYIDEKANS